VRALLRGTPGSTPSLVNAAFPPSTSEISNSNISIIMPGLEVALEALKLSGSVNYAATSKLYKYDETMLRRCH